MPQSHIGSLLEIKALPVGAVYLHHPDIQDGTLEINSFSAGARVVFTEIVQLDRFGNSVNVGYRATFEGIFHQSDFETNIFNRVSEFRNTYIRKVQFDCTSKDFLTHDYNAPTSIGASVMLQFKSPDNLDALGNPDAGTARIFASYEELTIEGFFPSNKLKVNVLMRQADFDACILHNIR